MIGLSQIRKTKLPNLNIFETNDFYGGDVRIKIKGKITKEQARFLRLFYSKYWNKR